MKMDLGSCMDCKNYNVKEPWCIERDTFVVRPKITFCTRYRECSFLQKMKNVIEGMVKT